jgi:hypothetical protein
MKARRVVEANLLDEGKEGRSIEENEKSEGLDEGAKKRAGRYRS